MKMKAPSKRSVRLVASEQDIPASPDNVRVVVLRYRGLEPTAKYKSFDGQTKPIGDVAADAKLILLWASWCPTCRTELQELAKHAGRIRGAGIEILALNIDDADLSHPEDGTDAAKFLHEIDFPFPSGIAEHELLGDLEELDADTLQRHRPLPVPTSFLIAADGTIVALYKGPVDVAQLIADAGMRQRSADEVRNAAVPLAGRWSMPQGEMPRVDPSISMYWSALLADFKSLLLLAAIPVLLIALIVYRLRRWSAARTRRREAAPSN